jgi:hypothetical protein
MLHLDAARCSLLQLSRGESQLSRSESQLPQLGRGESQLPQLPQLPQAGRRLAIVLALQLALIGAAGLDGRALVPIIIVCGLIAYHATALALCTIALSVSAAAISSGAKHHSTVVVCCIVTAFACAVHQRGASTAGASVAGTLFAVIVMNDSATDWDWDIMYALAVAILISTLFSRVYADAAEDDTMENALKSVSFSWYQTIVRA